MKYGFRYNLDLPEEVSSILEQEFWIMENVGSEVLLIRDEPVKFSASTWIFVKKGSCRAEINLINYEFEGPTLVLVENSQILTPRFMSDDFEASIMVISKRFRDNLFLFMNNMPLYSLISRHPVVKIPEGLMPDIDKYFRETRSILSDVTNPYRIQALLFSLSTFLFRTVYKFYEPYKDEILSNQGRMSNQFLQLAQQNFRQERFLDFYARKLEVTPKHLSRTLKNQTGYTAVEWIERFVILEAKVLLKSSNLNIQQISDELNFPSQSFFGKYFKKITGMSPKEFRNS